MKRPSDKTINAQLEGVCAVCDEADAFYAGMIRGGWNGILARRFRRGCLLADAASVLKLDDWIWPDVDGIPADACADVKAILRFAAKNGRDQKRIASVAYAILLEHLRRTKAQAVKSARVG